MGRPMIPPSRPGPRLVRNAGRRGVGDYFADNCTGPASFGTILNPFCWLYPERDLAAQPAIASKAVSNVLSPYNPPPLPGPIAEPTSITPNGGTDAAGNPTYDITFQTPAENQAANAANAQAFFNNLADQNAAANPTSNTLWIIAGVVLIGGLWFFGGRH